MIKVARATTQNVATVNALRARELPGVSGDLSSARVRYLLQSSDPHTQFLVAKDNGRIVGYAIVEDNPRPQPFWFADASISELAVDSGHRGTGVGTALVEAIVAQASRRGIGLLQGVTSSTSEGFFRSAGFEVLPPNHALAWMQDSADFEGVLYLHPDSEANGPDYDRFLYRVLDPQLIPIHSAFALAEGRSGSDQATEEVLGRIREDPNVFGPLPSRMVEDLRTKLAREVGSTEADKVAEAIPLYKD